MKPSALGYLLIILLTCSFNQVSAQNQEHDHSIEHTHGHHLNETGIGLMGAYIVQEKEWAPMVHAHYIRFLKNSLLGFGAGYEKIFDHHGHNTITLVASIRPLEQLSFNLAPGLTFENLSEFDPHPVMHAEVLYEFVLDHFHIGPIVEFAWGPGDSHVSIGLHIGLGY